jgi:hypothetical protein
MKKRQRELPSPIPDVRRAKKMDTEKDCGKSAMPFTRTEISCVDATGDESLDLFSHENEENSKEATYQGKTEENGKRNNLEKGEVCSVRDATNNVVSVLIQLFFLYISFHNIPTKNIANQSLCVAHSGKIPFV